MGRRNNNPEMKSIREVAKEEKSEDVDGELEELIY